MHYYEVDLLQYAGPSAHPPPFFYFVFLFYVVLAIREITPAEDIAWESPSYFVLLWASLYLELCSHSFFCSICPLFWGEEEQISISWGPCYSILYNVYLYLPICINCAYKYVAAIASDTKKNQRAVLTEV